MDAAQKDPTPEQAPVALIVLTALVYVAGFSMVIAWFALVVLGPPGTAATTRSSDAATCRICGVVEGVAEFERASFQLNGEQNEGIVVLLAQLGGLKGAPVRGRVYETAVLHDDGSVRVVRDTVAPPWKRGDRVKVIRGRIEPIALAQPGRS
jgi:hypothetical protein